MARVAGEVRKRGGRPSSARELRSGLESYADAKWREGTGWSWGEYSLTTAASDPYVPGSGTSTWLDVRAAFQYRFDLAGAKPPVKASVQTSKR